MESTSKVTLQKKPKNENSHSTLPVVIFWCFRKLRATTEVQQFNLKVHQYQVQFTAITHTKKIMYNAIFTLWSLYFKENAEQEKKLSRPHFKIRRYDQ